MALTFSRFLYGWEVTTSNRDLPFDRGAVDKNGVVALGVYTPDEFATAVAAAMNAADAGQTYTCTFSYSTGKFTIANGAAFILEFSRNPTTNANGLLGFPDSDTGSATSHVSVDAAGSGSSTMGAWTLAEPNEYHTPVVAQAAGAAALRGRRRIRTVQNVSDGGLVDTIFLGQDKLFEIGFKALTDLETNRMETFLDWIVRGRRFTWQPDSTSVNYLKLVLNEPSQVNPDFEWLTRSELSYGRLLFVEQPNRL